MSAKLSIFRLLVLIGISLSAYGQELSDNEAAASRNMSPVGQVNLVIGRAFLSSEVSKETRIRRGDILREGNIIRTESNGHVHIKFLDEAVMSVRPNSELHILTYRFDESQPENALVKFNLLEGTARSVSGMAAKTARDRFRLNTPIAAIGVRGTDFVVSTTPDSLMALVNEGAIVVAPYSDQCAAQGIGPCDFNAVELDGGSMQIIEYDSTMNTPQLVPVLASGQDAQQLSEIFSGVAARDQSFRESSQQNLDVAPQSEDEQNASVKEVVAESVTSLELGDNSRRQAPYETGFTPVSQIVPDELRKRQLVWGRFADGKGNLERLTLPMSEASQGRNVTVGGNFEYFLFRPEAGEVQVESGLGEIGFFP